MKISMDLLKQLREMTFAPLKDCKEALVEAEWDLQKANEILKEKWILKAWKKADRATNEGTVKLSQKWDTFAAIKLLCETDFVAKNETFQELVDTLLNTLLDSETPVLSLDAVDAWLRQSLDDTIAAFVGKIGENVQLWDVVIGKENVFLYNHPWNKVAAIVYYSGDEDAAKELALQTAAMSPTYLSLESVPQDVYNELRDKFSEELKDSGKPQEVIEQILKGKINKALSDVVLLEQAYIRDGAKKVKEILPESFDVQKFIRFSI